MYLSLLVRLDYQVRNPLVRLDQVLADCEMAVATQIASLSRFDLPARALEFVNVAAYLIWQDWRDRRDVVTCLRL